ncbi:MAG: hypothetical protein ACOZNI_12140 [Myxococcota bacterium]
MWWLLACGPNYAPLQDEPYGAGEDADDCGTWSTVGQPFALTWCAGCHSSHLSGEARHGATAGLDFESLDAVSRNAGAMRGAVERGTMPPGGGPSDGEKARLYAWFDCGLPGEEATLPVSDGDDGLLGATTAMVTVATERDELVLVAVENAGARTWTERWREDGSIVAWEVAEDGVVTEGTSWDPPLRAWDGEADAWTTSATATDLVTGERVDQTWTATLTRDDVADPRTRDESPDTVELVEESGATMGFQLSETRSIVYRWHDGASFQQDGLGGEDFRGLDGFPLADGLGWGERVLLREAR